MRGISIIALFILAITSTSAFADCEYDGKAQGEGAVLKFADEKLYRCLNTTWVPLADHDNSKLHIIDSNYGIDTPAVSCDPTSKLRERYVTERTSVRLTSLMKICVAEMSIAVLPSD